MLLSTPARHPVPRQRRRHARLLSAALSLAVLVSAGCANPQTFDRSLQPITQPYAFSLGQWELKMASNGLGQPLFARKDPDGVTKVKQYFAFSARISRLQSELTRPHASTPIPPLETQLDSLQ